MGAIKSESLGDLVEIHEQANCERIIIKAVIQKLHNLESLPASCGGPTGSPDLDF
jgi:hypothetical protein